jgi:hypothetical protein
MLTYDIAVSDRAVAHNFHLQGPGVEMSTPIGDKQETTWTVTFGDGRYTYVCDAHSSQMRGYFLAGNVPPTTAAAAVGPKKTISLKPKPALPGPATIVVNDRSKTDIFHLSGPGVNRKTGVKTRGRHGTSRSPRSLHLGGQDQKLRHLHRQIPRLAVRDVSRLPVRGRPWTVRS